MPECPHCACWPDHPNNQPCHLCHRPRWMDPRPTDPKPMPAKPHDEGNDA